MKVVRFIKKKYYTKERKIAKFISNGSIPWSFGYDEYKWQKISEAIKDFDSINIIERLTQDENWGYGLDERIVEYPWIISNLENKKTKLLDAGSTFNYIDILEHSIIKNKEISILTYYPEPINFNQNRVSYQYADLRELPYKDNYFEEVVCQSTLEHIDMDNSMYGYDLQSSLSHEREKSYDYLNVISELLRVLKSKGTLLITVPFGVFENHGFFQQFDKEMIAKLELILEHGELSKCFYKYVSSGWISSTLEDCAHEVSYNPHTKIGQGDDGAAHSRSVCCIKFVKE